MSQSPINTNRLADGDFDFKLGVVSNLHPPLVPENTVSWGINVVNVDGTLDTRPGYSSIWGFGTGKAQGFCLFTPTNGVVNMVAAISGKIWVSPYPFTDWTVLQNINFDPWVDHVVFKEAVQALVNGTLVGPTNMLIMQDGMSRAAFWDGSNNRHLIPGGSTNETIQGLWMEWIGSRLWVSRGTEVFASDLYDPLHFTETQYLAEGGSLQAIDGKPVTGMARTADDKSLIIFTDENTTIVAASITDRNQWKTTLNFISLLFPGVGCCAGKAICYLNGEMWWMSKEGVRRFIQVGATILQSKNNICSQEISRSYDNLSPILSRCCAFGFGGTVGFSVPSGDVYNRHTWVSDCTSDIGRDAYESWYGIWMGTRPVQWAAGTVHGKSRCYHLSQDRIGGVHVWEAFIEDERNDDGGRIFCSVEGRGLGFKKPFSFKRFKYTDLHLISILGDVDFTVEYRGDYGCWKTILDVKLCAERCRQLRCDNQNGAVSPQSRYLRSQESKPDCNESQGPYSNDIGTFFQNRFRWYGECGIVKYRSQAVDWQEPPYGACEKGDVDKDGNLECTELFCCDMEVDYISIPNSHPYFYNSSLSPINPGYDSEFALEGSL